MSWPCFKSSVLFRLKSFVVKCDFVFCFIDFIFICLFICCRILFCILFWVYYYYFFYYFYLFSFLIYWAHLQTQIQVGLRPKPKNLFAGPTPRESPLQQVFKLNQNEAHSSVLSGLARWPPKRPPDMAQGQLGLVLWRTPSCMATSPSSLLSPGPVALGCAGPDHLCMFPSPRHVISEPRVAQSAGLAASITLLRCMAFPTCPVSSFHGRCSHLLFQKSRMHLVRATACTPTQSFCYLLTRQGSSWLHPSPACIAALFQLTPPNLLLRTHCSTLMQAVPDTSSHAILYNPLARLPTLCPHANSPIFCAHTSTRWQWRESISIFGYKSHAKKKDVWGGHLGREESH